MHVLLSVGWLCVALFMHRVRLNKCNREHFIGETQGAYLIIIKNCISSGLYDMIIPPVQSEICVKVPWIFEAFGTIFWKEDMVQNVFRVACERKQMGNVEQNREVLRMVLLFLVLRHVKLISTLTEAKIMALISA